MDTEYTELLESINTYERESKIDTSDAHHAAMFRTFLIELPKFRSYITRTGRHHIGKTAD